MTFALYKELLAGIDETLSENPKKISHPVSKHWMERLD
jgi:hypothetical protein